MCVNYGIRIQLNSQKGKRDILHLTYVRDATSYSQRLQSVRSVREGEMLRQFLSKAFCLDLINVLWDKPNMSLHRFYSGIPSSKVLDIRPKI